MIECILSGGQTGADRAALDVARELGIPIGGFVPLNRRAEDGPIPPRYENLTETESANPAVRTECNVLDSDATLIVSHGPLVGGSALTRRLAVDIHVRPCLHLDLLTFETSDEAAELLKLWLVRHRHFIRRLNVAGPRSSEDPNVYNAVRDVLRRVLVDEISPQYVETGTAGNGTNE